MRRAFGALLVALAVLPSTARGQQGDTLALSLDRALEIARAGNPEYRRAVHSLQLNGPETWLAWGGPGGVLPSLTAGIATEYGGNRQGQALDPFGNPVANPNAEFIDFSSTRQLVGLQWQIQGISPLVRARRQRVVNGQRALEERLAGEALRIEVQRRFFAVLEEEELLAAEQAVADATGVDRETAERLFELALRSRVDVLQAELAVQRQALAVRQQVGRRDQARLALRAVLGARDLPPVRPAPTEAPVFDPGALDAEALVRRAVEQGGAVRRQGAALGLADQGVASARGSYWPQLTASFQLSRTVQSLESTTSLFSVGALPDRRFSLAISIPFVNNAFGSRAAIVAAEVAREGQRDALRQAQLDAEQQSRSALVALQNQWETVRIADRQLAVAGEALELAREEYRLGTRTFDQLQQSVADEAGSRRQAIQARHGFVRALLDLEAAVGGPVR